MGGDGLGVGVWKCFQLSNLKPNCNNFIIRSILPPNRFYSLFILNMRLILLQKSVGSSFSSFCPPASGTTPRTGSASCSSTSFVVRILRSRSSRARTKPLPARRPKMAARARVRYFLGAIGRSGSVASSMTWTSFGTMTSATLASSSLLESMT